ncbi:YiiX family permuted papain-like enzyme [soil metagenome]
MTVFATALTLCSCANTQSNQFHDGDIIFQTSKSSQSQAIQAATHSKYSHMGILFHTANNWFVYEAVGPVKSTAVKEWIERGRGQHYAIMRLKEPQTLDASQLKKLKDAGLKYQGKPYDQFFGWSDHRIYCSELVWKMYKSALGIELGRPSTLESFDLSAPAVKLKLKERYGNNVPLKEQTISPSAIYNCKLLYTVD